MTHETGWMDRAKCTTTAPETFFPDPQDKPAVIAAQLICSTCPVAKLCDKYATRNRIRHGMWGGKLRVERHAHPQNS